MGPSDTMQKLMIGATLVALAMFALPTASADGPLDVPEPQECYPIVPPGGAVDCYSGMYGYYVINDVALWTCEYLFKDDCDAPIDP